MYSDSSYSAVAIFRRLAPSILSSLLLSLFLFFAVTVTGCTDTTLEVSPETVRALTILGGIDQGNGPHVVGGLRALDGMEAFLAAIDTRMAARSQDQLYELLEHLGLDPATESVSIYFSIEDVRSYEMPGVVVFAPLTEARLDSLLENMPSAGHISFQRSGNSFSFRDTRSEKSIYFSLIEEQVLLVAASQSELDIMHARAHGAPDESSSEQQNKISSLTIMASQGQFWIVSESVQSLVGLFPYEAPIQEIELLTKAASGAALSIDIHENGADGPAMTLSLYLSPREGVDVDDLVDLAEGLVGLGRLQRKDLPEIGTVIDLLEISERNGTARIAIDISAFDIGTLLRRTLNPETAEQGFTGSGSSSTSPMLNSTILIL